MPMPQTPKHDFLHELHKLFRPARYLEIGVQTGRSMAQAIPPTVCIGVDPAPCIDTYIPAPHRIYPITSDKFFTEIPPGTPADVNFTFIDGMHLIENVMRDFMCAERQSHPEDSIIVIDDVLPYSRDIAYRTQPPGDWAGDAWKAWEILTKYRPDLALTLVDVAPTGLLVVQELSPGDASLSVNYGNNEDVWMLDVPVPHHVINRVDALKPADALEQIERNRT